MWFACGTIPLTFDSVSETAICTPLEAIVASFFPLCQGAQAMNIYDREVALQTIDVVWNFLRANAVMAHAEHTN